MRITAAWQEQVRDRIRELGKNQKWLADQVGATPGAISGMLKPGAPTSRLVIPVCKVLDLPEPVYQDPRDAEFVDLSRRLRDIDPRLYDKIYDQIQRRLRETKEEDES